jgi:hypothetical protein
MRCLTPNSPPVRSPAQARGPGTFTERRSRLAAQLVEWTRSTFRASRPSSWIVPVTDQFWHAPGVRAADVQKKGGRRTNGAANRDIEGYETEYVSTGCQAQPGRKIRPGYRLRGHTACDIYEPAAAVPSSGIPFSRARPQNPFAAGEAARASAAAAAATLLTGSAAYWPLSERNRRSCTE